MNAHQPPAVVHVDLDGARHIYANNGWPYPWGDDPLFESGLRNLLAFFERNAVKATLFVIAEDLEDAAKRPLLEAAAAAGHEIASHTSTHPRLNEQSSERKRAEVFDSRRRLGEALGVDVAGFRAPSYSIDREVLDFLVKAGYSWDSSVFPTRAFADRLGLAEVGATPFQPVDFRGLWELPLPAHKPGPFPFHPCYALILGRTYFHWRLRAFRATGHPLVMLFHLTDLADPLPADRLTGWKSKLMTLSHRTAAIKTSRCQRMLDAVRLRYRMVTTDELLKEQR